MANTLKIPEKLKQDARIQNLVGDYNDKLSILENLMQESAELRVSLGPDNQNDPQIYAIDYNISVAILDYNRVKKTLEESGIDVSTLNTITTQTQTQTQLEIEKLNYSYLESIKKAIFYIINPEFSIRNINRSLDIISEMNDRNDKILTLNWFLGYIEDKGYTLYIDGDKIKVLYPESGKHNLKNEIESTLETSIKAGKIDLDLFKHSILVKTTGIVDYFNGETHNGQLDASGVTAKDYYEKLMEKNNFSTSGFFNASIEDIKNSSLPLEDKSFLISYKKGAYEKFSVEKSIIESVEQRKKISSRIRSGLGPENVDKLDKQSKAIDGRSIDERVGDFIRNPFRELNLIMGEAGGIGGLAILGALIYFGWNHTKTFFGGIAIWGVLKGVGMLDTIADGFDGVKPLRVSFKFVKEWARKIWGKSNLIGLMNEWGNRLKMWYYYSNYNVEFGNQASKSFINTNFIDFYRNRKLIRIKRSDGKQVDKVELDSTKNGMISNIEEIYNKGMAKYNQDESKFFQAIKGMEVWQVIDHVTDLNKKTNQLNQTQNSQNPSSGVVVPVVVPAGSIASLETQIEVYEAKKTLSESELNEYFKLKIQYAIENYSGIGSPTKKEWLELYDKYIKLEKQITDFEQRLFSWCGLELDYSILNSFLDNLKISQQLLEEGKKEIISYFEAKKKDLFAYFDSNSSAFKHTDIKILYDKKINEFISKVKSAKDLTELNSLKIDFEMLNYFLLNVYLQYKTVTTYDSILGKFHDSSPIYESSLNTRILTRIINGYNFTINTEFNEDTLLDLISLVNLVGADGNDEERKVNHIFTKFQDEVNYIISLIPRNAEYKEHYKRYLYYYIKNKLTEINYRKDVFSRFEMKDIDSLELETYGEWENKFI